VLPLARPIIGVISLLTLIGAYKDFLWPLLVLPRAELQPISVALPRVESSTDLAVFMAALFISVVVPVALFLAFQRQFLRAAGSAGAIKE
jgi:multiple sugar transport system permease protein